MIADSLFTLALDYKKTRLWKKLWDSELFAVALADGETGYCCVMGKNGEYNALALYVGQEGANSYWTIRSAQWTQDQADFQESILSQNCIQCSFGYKEELSKEELEAARAYGKRNGHTFRGGRAFPQFTRYLPYCYPWPVREEGDQALLSQALSAALEVSRRVEAEGKTAAGFRPLRDQGSNQVPLLTRKGEDWVWSMTALPGPVPMPYPRPVLSDDMLTARLKKRKKKGELQCEVLCLPEPVIDAEGEPPRFPVLLFTLNPETGYLFPCVPITRYREDPQPLLVGFCQELARQKTLPQTIFARDERTESLLRDLCSKVNIQLVRQRLLPDLDEVKDQFFNHLDETEEEIPQEMIEDMFSMMTELDEDTLATMPPPLMEVLAQMLEDGMLPSPLAEKISRVLGVSEEPPKDNGVILFPGWKGGS